MLTWSKMHVYYSTLFDSLDALMQYDRFDLTALVRYYSKIRKISQSPSPLPAIPEEGEMAPGGYAPRFTSALENIKGKLGDMAALRAVIDALPAPRIDW